MKFTLHPEAEEDLRAAARYYREHAGGSFSRALLAEFERCVELLLRHPRLGTLWRNDRRRLILQHFPFSIVYSVHDDGIRILAVAHHSRRPEYWRGRR